MQVHVKMHEFSISSNLVAAVFEHIDPGDRVSKVVVEIGSFSGIDSESLIFCFDAIKAETALKNSELEIIYIDTLMQCRECKTISKVSDYFFLCPECGSVDADITQGDGIFLKTIEIDVEVLEDG